MPPRFAGGGGQITSVQVTCVRPHHFDNSRCTREVALTQANGCVEHSKHMLVTWLVWGWHSATKAEHKKVWAAVVEASKEGTLPDLDTLRAIQEVLEEEQNTQEVKALKATLLQENKKKSRTTATSAASSRSPAPPAPEVDILGGLSPGVSPELHDRMCQLARDGQLPVTSPSQRSRNVPTKNTAYKTPACWTDAFRSGYIHPNLPAPLGWIWRRRDSTMILLPRGG